MPDSNSNKKQVTYGLSGFLADQQFLFATILLSEQCNASCPNCINSMQRNQRSHMDEKKLKILVEDLLSDNFPNLKLLGGEPTVHPNFLDLYKYFQGKFTHVTLFTNALNDKIKKITPRQSDYVTYNGYFVNNSFDTDKFLPHNPEPFFRTIQNVVNTSFDFGKFKERAIFTRDFFRSVNLEKHYTMALSIDCTEDIFGYAEELNRIFLDVIRFLVENNVNFTTHRNAPVCFFVNPELAKLQEKHNFFPYHICDISYGQAIIDTDFNLKYCDRMPKILGSVFRNDFETIDFEEFKLMMHQGYVWKMRDNYKLRCKGCKLWLKECNGGCYANNSSAVFNENIRLDVKCNTSD